MTWKGNFDTAGRREEVLPRRQLNSTPLSETIDFGNASSTYPKMTADSVTTDFGNASSTYPKMTAGLNGMLISEGLGAE